MKVFISRSSAETKKFAEKLAKQIANRKAQSAHRTHALVLALVGELGSGKTTFVQGFFKGLGIKKRALSPTFIIVRRFALRDSRFAHVYHVDAYRIKKPKELLKIGFKEILSDPKNIVLIEWADKIRKILPRRARWLSFSHGEAAHKRILL